MLNTKTITSMVALLLFLVAVLICGPISLHPVFAAPPDACFGDGCSNTKCVNQPEVLYAQCCWTEGGHQYCQGCSINTNTGEFEKCSDVIQISKGRPDSSIIAPPPSGVAPPPSTTTCPANTALDANGNCAPLTQAPTDRGTTTQPPTGDNTNPKHHKGSELSQLPPLIGDNNNNNNDNKPSKHHKGDTSALQ